MAVTFGDIATADAENSAGSLTIPKPTGLAEGNLMIAFLGGLNTTTSWTLTGWTEVTSSSSTDFLGSVDGVHTVLAKIATSSDVSASNFTFSSAGADEARGTLVYLESSADGFTISIIQDRHEFDSGFASSSGVTPLSPDCFLLFGLFISSDTEASGYAIATDNPTWTERTDRTTDGWAQNVGQALATAPRPEATATGSYSATLTAFVGGATINKNTFGALLAVNEDVNVTVNATPLTTSTTVPEETVTADANVTVTPITASVTVTSASVTSFEATVWTLESTPSVTWTNEDKI